MLQTLPGRTKVAPLHHDHAQVVQSLHVVRLHVQDLLVALLGRLQVSDVVDVDVAEEDESLDMMCVMPEQLEEEGQVEQSTSEVWLDLYRFPEPGLGFTEILIVH